MRTHKRRLEALERKTEKLYPEAVEVPTIQETLDWDLLPADELAWLEELDRKYFAGDDGRSLEDRMRQMTTEELQHYGYILTAYAKEPPHKPPHLYCDCCNCTGYRSWHNVRGLEHDLAEPNEYKKEITRRMRRQMDEHKKKTA